MGVLWKIKEKNEGVQNLMLMERMITGTFLILKSNKLFLKAKKIPKKS